MILCKARQYYLYCEWYIECWWLLEYIASEYVTRVVEYIASEHVFNHCLFSNLQCLQWEGMVVYTVLFSVR